MGGRGNSGSRNTQEPEYNKNFKQWLDNAGGYMYNALQDILYDTVADTWEQGGKEYDIQWENGRFVTITKQATPEDPYVEFTADVFMSPAGTNKPAKQMTLKEGKKPKVFRVKVY